MKIDNRRSVALLSVVLLAALGLRLFHLQERVLWFDEANSLLIARAGPTEIIDAVRDDTHSPFYYLVLHYWQFIAGGEAGARLLSVLAGVATVAVVYSMGCALAGRGAGLLAAALLAVCPLHVWYSQEIRMYALQTLLVALSFLFMVWALRQQRGVLWVGYSVFTALSLYAQYASFYALVAQNIFVAIYYWRDRQK
ncbi:MAG: glycosyltransferase family 39 protein, partial [Verrucomicrobiia bacterium]